MQNNTNVHRPVLAMQKNILCTLLRLSILFSQFTIISYLYGKDNFFGHDWDMKNRSYFSNIIWSKDDLILWMYRILYAVVMYACIFWILNSPSLPCDNKQWFVVLHVGIGDWSCMHSYTKNYKTDRPTDTITKGKDAHGGWWWWRFFVSVPSRWVWLS